MVLQDSALPRYRRDQEAFRVLTGLGASKDILVLTRKEFESQRKAPSSLPATVEREGILLYAAEDNAMAKTEVFIAENLKWAHPQPEMKLKRLLSS
ncbi:hypothetical protein [Nitrospira sp. M1]